jgi:hypothetical protein
MTTAEHVSMQTVHDFHLYEQAVRTQIGDALQTLFVPTEPAPKRLLDLLNALEGDDTDGSEERWEWDEKPLGDTAANRVQVIRDATGRALVYLYCRVDDSEARQANVLTEDEARLLAIGVAKLQRLSRRCGRADSVSAWEERLDLMPCLCWPHTFSRSNP